VLLNIRTPAADQDGGKVFDVGDPDRHGVILKAGFDVSEVRYDDGAVRIVANDHLRPVELPTSDNKPDDGFSQLNPSPSDVVRLGQEAMARKRRGWDDWLLIAEALRRHFGLWDEFDPVANAILDLVEAQNELAQAFSAQQYDVDGAPEVGSALEKRSAAARKLIDAIHEHESWF
jgi:hypothetical protein